MLNVLILQCRTNIFMNKGSALLPIKNKISKLRILELTNYRHNSIISDKIVYFREHVFLNSFTRENCNIELAKSKYILIIVILLSIAFPIESIIFKFASGQVENFQSEDKQNNIPFSQEKPEIDVSIDGTSSDDKIKGGAGDDDINGRLGNDMLFGGRGDDELDGDGGLRVQGQPRAAHPADLHPHVRRDVADEAGLEPSGSGCLSGRAQSR